VFQVLMRFEQLSVARKLERNFKSLQMGGGINDQIGISRVTSLMSNFRRTPQVNGNCWRNWNRSRTRW